MDFDGRLKFQNSFDTTDNSVITISIPMGPERWLSIKSICYSCGGPTWLSNTNMEAHNPVPRDLTPSSGL